MSVTLRLLLFAIFINYIIDVIDINHLSYAETWRLLVRSLNSQTNEEW